MNQIEKTLTDFGLTKNEITIYLECVKESGITPFKLAKLTSIPRTTVYDILLNLSFKGLIEIQQSQGFEKQQTKINAKNPFIMRTILQEKRKQLAELEDDIIQILPFLKNEFLKNTIPPFIQFFPGKEGLKKVYLAELENKPTAEALVFDNLMPMDVLSWEEINEDVRKSNNDTDKVVYKEIIPLVDWAKHVTSYQFLRDENYIKIREIRYLENPIYDMTCRISIIGNFVRIMTSNENEAWGLIIKSKELSNTLTSLHKVLWSQATKVTEEVVKSWGRNLLYEAEVKKGLL